MSHILQLFIAWLFHIWRNLSVTGIVAGCLRLSAVTRGFDPIMFQCVMSITVDYTTVKKSPGVVSRNKRRGPIKRVVRSHTVWSSEEGCAFEASSWELYRAISHLKKKAFYFISLTSINHRHLLITNYQLITRHTLIHFTLYKLIDHACTWAMKRKTFAYLLDLVAFSSWSLNFSIYSTSDQDSCKKISAAAFSAFNDARRLAIVKPAAENTLSDGADVAGIHRTLRASFDKISSLALLFFHHSSGLRYMMEPSSAVFLPCKNCSAL